MDLVNEKHIVWLKIGQQACQIARLVKHRPRGHLHIHAQLIGDNMRQRCLSQTGRAMQQRMVERFATLGSGLHENTQVVHHLLLTRKTVESIRAKHVFKVFLCL